MKNLQAATERARGTKLRGNPILRATAKMLPIIWPEVAHEIYTKVLKTGQLRLKGLFSSRHTPSYYRWNVRCLLKAGLLVLKAA